MKYPFFASFIIFCIWLSYEIRKAGKTAAKRESSFWEKESAANATRRKPLDDLDYIYVPLDKLPTGMLTDVPEIQTCIETVRELSDTTIVNLIGQNNTDLKLRYGAPNLDILIQYDQNYTSLITTLQRWAEALFEHNCRQEASLLLEYAIQTGSDITASYRLLARIYKELGTKEKISDIIHCAKQSAITETRKQQLIDFLSQML